MHPDVKNLNTLTIATSIKLSVIAFIAIALLFGYAFASSPTSCPFVNPNTGLDCIGVPMPDGYSVAGEKWRCNKGHKWIVKD